MSAAATVTPFHFNDYRKYLAYRLKTVGKTRGLRSKIALSLKTKPSFISQVLSGKNDFTPEHCPVINEILNHTEAEAHYFILLVQVARAGHFKLKAYYQAQIDEILEKRKQNLGRLKAEPTLIPSEQAIYYSYWYYGAIHVLTSIPQFQTKPALAKRLNLKLEVVSQAVDQLVKLGLLMEQNGRYEMTEKQVLIDKDSPWVAQMHTHYRLRAVHSLTEPDSSDFHYSLGVTLSKKDFEEIRERLFQFLEELNPKIRQSKEEEGYCLGLDFFKL